MSFIAVVVISLPALRGLLTTKVGRTNAGYNSGGPKGQSSGQKSGNSAGISAGSQSNSGHIKLHSLSIGKRNRNTIDGDGSSSEEELRRTYDTGAVPPTSPHSGPGINKTTEVFVSSSPRDGMKNGQGFGFWGNSYSSCWKVSIYINLHIYIYIYYGSCISLTIS